MKKWKLVALAAGAGLATVGGLTASVSAAAVSNPRGGDASSAVSAFLATSPCVYVGTTGLGTSLTPGQSARAGAATAACPTH